MSRWAHEASSSAPTLHVDVPKNIEKYRFPKTQFVRNRFRMGNGQRRFCKQLHRKSSPFRNTKHRNRRPKNVIDKYVTTIAALPSDRAANGMKRYVYHVVSIEIARVVVVCHEILLPFLVCTSSLPLESYERVGLCAGPGRCVHRKEKELSRLEIVVCVCVCSMHVGRHTHARARAPTQE